MFSTMIVDKEHLTKSSSLQRCTKYLLENVLHRFGGKVFSSKMFSTIYVYKPLNQICFPQLLLLLAFLYILLLKRAEYHVHISDMGVDECPLTDSEYKTEQPSGCFRLPSQQSSCCSRTEASSSIS